MLRKAAGLSQSELAKLLKISNSTIGMYEQGRREPSLEILTELSRIFGVSLDFLVLGKATTDLEIQALNDVLLDRVDITEKRLDARAVRPFSREELAVLFCGYAHGALTVRPQSCTMAVSERNEDRPWTILLI